MAVNKQKVNACLSEVNRSVHVALMSLTNAYENCHETSPARAKMVEWFKALSGVQIETSAEVSIDFIASKDRL